MVGGIENARVEKHDTRMQRVGRMWGENACIIQGAPKRRKRKTMHIE